MEKILINYELLRSTNPIELSKQVQNRIDDGMDPFGSPGISTFGSPDEGWDAIYIQAVVRWEDDLLT